MGARAPGTIFCLQVQRRGYDGRGNLYLIGVLVVSFHGVEQPKSFIREAPTYFDTKIQLH